MRKKPPAYQWYVKEWLSSPTRLSLSKAARSAYRDLLDYCWDCGGSLPNDQETLRVMADCTSEEWAEFGNKVLQNFCVNRAGRLINRKLSQLWKERKDFIDSRIEAAKASWGQHSKRTARAVQVQCSPSPSPSPSTTKTLKPIARQKTASETEGFRLFYQSYPRKVGRVIAARAWKKNVPDDSKWPDVIASVEDWKRSEQWQDSQFIPHPATFLNQRRWTEPCPSEIHARRNGSEMYCDGMTMEQAKEAKRKGYIS